MVIRRSVVGSALLFSVFGSPACIAGKAGTVPDSTTRAEGGADTTPPPGDQAASEAVAEVAPDTTPEATTDTTPEATPDATPDAAAQETVADASPDLPSHEAGSCEPQADPAVLAGKPCPAEQEYKGLCDPQDPQKLLIACSWGTWKTGKQLADGGEWCYCTPVPCEWDNFGCAVPGFVGLDRAGRPRRGGRPLRYMPVQAA